MRRIIAFIILVILVILMITLSYNFYSKNKKSAKNNLNSTLKVTKKKTDDIEIKTNQKEEDKDYEVGSEDTDGDLAVEESAPVPDTASEDEEGYIPIKAYDVSPDKTVLKVKETGKISVSIYPKDASNREVVFLSSNPKVLKVDSFGKMKALKTGEVTVTVKVSGQRDSSFIVSVK